MRDGGEWKKREDESKGGIVVDDIERRGRNTREIVRDDSGQVWSKGIWYSQKYTDIFLRSNSVYGRECMGECVCGGVCACVCVCVSVCVYVCGWV